MENYNELVPVLNDEMNMNLKENISSESLVRELTNAVNYLIEKDFSQLLSILYRMDVSENKIRQMLNESINEDAGKIITALIIERQLQKITSRKQFSQRDDNIDENEKW